jgi:hypothetical protein
MVRRQLVEEDLMIEQHPLAAWRAKQIQANGKPMTALMFSALSGVDVSVVSKIESGKKQPTTQIMIGVFHGTKGKVTPHMLLNAFLKGKVFPC